MGEREANRQRDYVVVRAPSRRGILVGSAKLVGSGVLALAFAVVPSPRILRSGLAQSQVDVSTPTGVLNYALTLEHLEAAFYREGLAGFEASDFEAGVFDNLGLIRGHEADHVAALTAAVSELGGVPVEEAAYDFGEAFGDPDAFLATAQALENTGVAAYTGAAQYLIGSPELLTAALTIHGVEARHASYLNRLNGVSPFPDAVDAPLTPDEVLTIATPFIADAPAAQAGGSQAPGEVATVEEEEVARGGGRRNRVNEMPSVGVGTGLQPAAHADVQKIGLAGLAGVAATISMVLAYHGRASETTTAGGGSDR
ncbi:MAG: ferritin-like domain-containing protein [Chloroflexi bacterium]|nr:ferritin-like domain-containing protein [Chloroflexota bacterium]